MKLQRRPKKFVREQGRAVPGDGQNSEQRSAANKFAVVLKAAPMDEAELGPCCRRKGLLVEQLERWRSGVHAVLSGGQWWGGHERARHR